MSHKGAATRGTSLLVAVALARFPVPRLLVLYCKNLGKPIGVHLANGLV